MKRPRGSSELSGRSVNIDHSLTENVNPGPPKELKHGIKTPNLDAILDYIKYEDGFVSRFFIDVQGFEARRTASKQPIFELAVANNPHIGPSELPVNVAVKYFQKQKHVGDTHHNYCANTCWAKHGISYDDPPNWKYEAPDDAVPKPKQREIAMKLLEVCKDSDYGLYAFVHELNEKVSRSTFTTDII